VATQQPSRDQPVSGWAVGGITFAACVLTLIGLFQIVAGLTAIFDDEFYVVTRNYTFDLDTTGWGWIHLLLGVLLVVTGYGLFDRQTWAGVTGDRARHAERASRLLLHPLLPVLGDRRDRPRCLGDLVADAP
jgi:hypothetical protein